MSSWGKGLWLGTSAFARLSRSFRATFADFHEYFLRTRLWGNENFVLAIPLSLFAPTFLDLQRSFNYNINLIQSYPSSILAANFGSHLPFPTNESNICHLSYIDIYCIFSAFAKLSQKISVTNSFANLSRPAFLAFAEPSDINSLTSYYTSGFLRCSPVSEDKGMSRFGGISTHVDDGFCNETWLGRSHSNAKWLCSMLLDTNASFETKLDAGYPESPK